MAVSKALMAIQKGQEQAIFDNLQVGDVVGLDLYSDATGPLKDGIVIKKHFPTSTLGPALTVLFLYTPNQLTTCLTSSLNVLKRFVFELNKEQLLEIKKCVEMAYSSSSIDNLTYIEILVRLREYEKTI
jgi:hypothetical protein